MAKALKTYACIYSVSTSDDASESPLEKLDRLSLRYRAKEVFHNQHYRDLCSRKDSRLCIPFQRPSGYHYIYIHKQTPITTLNELIRLARMTQHFSIDTQRDTDPCPWMTTNTPALVQIEFHSPLKISLVILIEVLHLPSLTSTRIDDALRRRKIERLCDHIFAPGNHLYMWGSLETKFDDFFDGHLFDASEMRHVHAYNIQHLFTQWYQFMFPHSSLKTEHSLQTAIFLTFNEWFDTRMRYAPWSIGIDLDLKLHCARLRAHQSHEYRSHLLRDEKEIRQCMQRFALDTCFAVSKLVALIFAEESKLKQIQSFNQHVIHCKRKKRHTIAVPRPPMTEETTDYLVPIAL